MKPNRHLFFPVICLFFVATSMCVAYANAGEAVANHAKIDCIEGKYLDGFLKKETIIHSFDQNILWKRLIKRKDIQDKNQIEFIKQYTLWQNEGHKKVPFGMEIWIMKTPHDAKHLFQVLDSLVNKSSLYEKPPKRFFVFENVFVLLTISSFGNRFIIRREEADIIQMCFESDSISIGNVP